MQKAISFEATAIAQYIYQNINSAIKERPQETSCFSFFLDTQQNKNCSNILSRHGTELWMPDFLIILFFGPSVKLTTKCKMWHLFWQICILIIFDHMSSMGKKYSKNTLGPSIAYSRITLKHSWNNLEVSLNHPRNSPKTPMNRPKNTQTNINIYFPCNNDGHL